VGHPLVSGYTGEHIIQKREDHAGAVLQSIAVLVVVTTVSIPFRIATALEVGFVIEDAFELAFNNVNP
jgi:mannitol-specific phosphotransferase system IIBC component